ncbi:ABC transporter binding protein, urea carboxylase region, partial [Candidatus Electrothrix marina]
MKHQSPVVLLTAAVVLSAVLFFISPLQAAEKKEKFDIAWSHYAGWEPWGYAQQSGILKKWADKHNIEIELTLVNDYIESINLYTTGKFAACTMTNMDALTIPAVGGIDSTAVIVGDFSNGNDGIIMKKGAKVTDLKGRPITLVELTSYGGVTTSSSRSIF